MVPRSIVRVLSLAAGAAALALTAPPAGAQAEERPLFWVSGGLGLGEIQDADDVAAHAMVGVARQRGPHVLGLRATVNAEIFDQGVLDVALLYGRGTEAQGGHAWIAAGPAFVYSELCPGLFDPAPCEADAGLGLVVVGHGSILLGGAFSLGLELSGNLNGLSSYVAGAVALRIGRLR